MTSTNPGAQDDKARPFFEEDDGLRGPDGRSFKKEMGMLSYLRSIRYSLSIVTLVFLFSTIMGYIYAATYPDATAQNMEQLGEMLGQFGELDSFSLMLFIFLNNSIKSFFVLMLGLGFGVIPLIFVASNGYILGMVVYMAALENGILFVAAAILPHGIIELPCILICAAIGLHIGREVMQALQGRENTINYTFIQGVKFFLYRMAPLLLLSAIIESYITPVIMGGF